MKTELIAFNSPKHAEAVKIRKQAFVIEMNIPEELEVDQYENSCEHFLTTIDGLPAGAGRLRVKDQYIKFERIACLKEFRGTGIGRNLMQKMTEHALSHHPKLIPYMHSQADAVPFYEKLGWSRQGDIFFEANIPHLAMTYKEQK